MFAKFTGKHLYQSIGHSKHLFLISAELAAQGTSPKKQL